MRRLLLTTSAAILLASPLTAVECGSSPYRNEVIVKVRHIVFRNAADVPQAEQDAIRRNVQSSFQDLCDFELGWRKAVEGQAETAALRWYQDRGYFKAMLEAKILAVEAKGFFRTVDLRLERINKGRLYRTGEIHWTGMAVFPEDELRHVMPIQSGEVFSRRRIAKGIEDLRFLYSSRGYINFISIPNIGFDDDNATVSLNIEIDEGTQFRFRTFSVAGLDDRRAHLWQEAWDKQMRGRPFSRDDLRVFLKQLFRPTDPAIDPLSVTQLEPDEVNASMDVAMTFYSKSAYDAMQSTFPPR